MLWLALCLGAASADDYLGRPIAPFMSVAGADWLEREGRAAEEGTRRLLRALDLRDGLRVADLGCGTGFHARRIRERVGDGSVACIDLQPAMLARAEVLAAEAGVQLDWVVGEHDRIPLPDASVDLLLMVDVWHEVQEPAQMLGELRRVLAPGGRVAIVEYRLEGNSAAHILREHRMTDEQVAAEFEAGGFRVARGFTRLPTQHLVIVEQAD
jgi:ubiquinone/menaquinone biosynthesis C-methylase UbiE